MKIKSKGAVAVCAIAVVLIIVLIVVGGNKGKNNNNPVVNNNTSSSQGNQEKENKVVEEFVQVQPNGGKVNTSSELKKSRSVAGLELTNIQLIENGGLSEFLADAKNTTNNMISELFMVITALDKNGNTLAEFEAAVFDVAAGATTKIHANLTADIANAYDFTIREK